MSSRFVVSAALSALALAGTVTSAGAASLVVNGNFEQLLIPGHAAEFGSRFASQQVTGWTTNGYNFVFTPGSADTTGATGEYGGLTLWGPSNGSANGLPATSPSGGNFLGMDGAYAVGPVSQTIHGLTPGVATTVSFYWAGAQQAGYSSANTEQFAVSLGSVTQDTPVASNASHGFTGWQHETFTFMPTSASELLSFLAIGTPGGVPPFSLLDGVAVSNTPEPASWGFLLMTSAGVGFAYLRRRLTRTSVRSDKA